MSTATAAKPAAKSIGGGIAFAPTTATLPTAANTALGTDFTDVGYVSTDGVKRSIGLDTNIVTEWGGSVVAVLGTGKTETFKFKVIDAYNVGVLAMVLGSASGTLQTGIVAKSTAAAQEPHAYVITMLETDGNWHRIVIPKGVITAIGKIAYVANDVTGYELTITGIEDADGATAYDYYLAATGTNSDNEETGA